jgi:ABC-2 type transport system ATP-binding protein
LRKLYKSAVAVSGIDFDVRRGEVFALLGPNGAGKTTTVEILEGFRSRDGGEVKVLGTDPYRARESWRARIGVVLQTTGQFEDLTVAEVVKHFTLYYPDAYDADTLIEMVGLTELQNRRTEKLSGGLQRRLDVALGIVGRPELLFLDEPSTGLDPQSRRGFWELIRGLADAGTTIVLTSHYMEEVESLADRAAVIIQGQILDIGPVATLGGRDAEAATVSWIGPNGRETVQSTVPAKVVADLASTFDGEPLGLEVRRPTLEDIYLQMLATSETVEQP